MKVALNLSGLSRTLSYSWLFIDKYIATPLKADIFLHTWDIDHSSSHGLSKGSTTLDPKFNAPSVFSETSKEGYILDELAPISYIIEPFENFALKEENHSTFAMYYGVQQANLLRKQHEKQKGISYDLVVRARLDSFFENTIPDKEIQEALDQDTLFVGCNCSEKNYIHTETTDVFAFAKGPIMDIYSDTFNLYNDGKNRDLLGERGLHRQLTNHNIQTKWSNMRMKLPTVWTSTEIAASGFFN